MKIFLNEFFLLTQEDWNPNDIEEVLENLTNLNRTLNCLNFHTEPTVYYSGEGLKRLFGYFEDLGYLLEYSLANPMNILRQILRDINAVNWDFGPMQLADHVYYFLSNGGANSYNVSNTSVAEAAEYRQQNYKAAVLNFQMSQFNETDPIHINRSRVNPPAEIVTVPLKVIVLKDNLLSYVVANRQTRTFNLSPKHGENGKGKWPQNDVSPLECSKKEATDLLDKAVTLRTTDELYALDIKRNKFVVFKSEHTAINSYHAYHPINQNDVPNEVKKFLREENR